ncbi:MAG: 2OG-Fe(II) oxygenase [Alphaproteobacteria bacterium]|nr:2OG-Fe(II) oxygenase [Alphaproteobacteria bacterium]
MAGLGVGDTLNPCGVVPLLQGKEEIWGEGTSEGEMLVIWLTRENPIGSEASAFASSVEFENVGAMPRVVIPGDYEAIHALPHEITETTVLDPSGAILNAFDTEDTKVVVLDPEGRISAVFPPAEWKNAVNTCREIKLRTEPTTVLAQAPCLLIPNIVEPELCHRIIDYWHEHDEKLVNVVSSSKQGNKVDGKRSKIRSDVMIDDPELLSALWLRFRQRVLRKVYKAFQFKTTGGWQTPRIGCYDARQGGEFKRHRDNMFPSASRNRSFAFRQFAVTINLNTGEYEGGQLWFPEYGQQRYVAGVGGAAIFSASLLHEALPVTKGRRFGLFTFLFDEINFKKRAEALEAERREMARENREMV